MPRTSVRYSLARPWGIALLLFAGLASAALAEGNPARVPILLDRDPGAAPAVRVLEENGEGLLLEFELPALEVETLDVEGERYQVLAIQGGAQFGAVGSPMLPTFSRWIQIPDRAGVQASVRAVETRVLSGYRPVPMQPDDASDGAGDLVIDAAAYARAGYGSAAPAVIGAPALMRDLRVVPITFQPVRYDPSRATLEVAGRIQVRVTFDGVDLRSTPSRHLPDVPSSFDRLYRGLVANYEGPRAGQSATLGSYLLLCHNDPGQLAAVQPLVEWRTRQGYEVHLATTADFGTTKESVKAWLQNAYDTWPNPPAFITLVGDANGAIAFPCWNESYSGFHGETDHNYVQLAGDDILADAHIGRLSVDSIDRLTLVVNKIVGYESAPFMADTTWFSRVCLVGDPNASGYTCVQIMQWLKERLRQIGYAEVDTVFSGNFVDRMFTDLNRGDTAFAYRGIQGMSGFTTGHIGALTNGWKLPFAVNLTCDTGSFAGGTSRSEAWLRAGIPPSTPTGGIASIGTATLGTDTRHNNCMMAGIWRGVFWEDLFQFGPSLTRGQYELYVNYAEHDYNEMCTFTCWNNLMGDAAGEMWTGVPRAMTVTAPDTIPRGTNAVTVEVAAGGAPLAGACVCLWKGLETHVVGYTDADGRVELLVSAPTAGAMKLTVTKHNCLPWLAAIEVATADRFVAYAAHSIDDDTSGASQGNGDGVLNPTERIELPVQVRNFGVLAAPGVVGTLTSGDPRVAILDGTVTFGDLAGGTAAWGNAPFVLEVSGETPDGHAIDLGLDLTSDTGTWRSLITLPVTAADFAYVACTAYGFGVTFDPGESGEISVRLRNQGGAAGSGVSGTLLSEDPWVRVTDGTGSFGLIPLGGMAENTFDRFGLSIRGDCIPGHLAELNLALQFSGGATDTVPFVMTVGTVATTDPTGPDRHGYYAFDNTDTTYPQAPAYAWIEIDPNHGGGGTSVGLTDYQEGQDDSRTIDLPFAFQYYGETFTRATICSNGWIAMGATYLTNYRNWNIPGAEAPANMIAPLWDDLVQWSTSLVYHLYDAAGHRYIVQWSRLYNMNGWQIENFELILYDPAYYPTSTGDGSIVFQYQEFHNCDWQQHYCTVGIENASRDDGVLYSYFGAYDAGAATIASGRAIAFTPLELTDPAAAPDGAQLPRRLALRPVTPDPWRASGGRAVARFDLPRAGAVRLSVLDVGGRRVRTLLDEQVAAGSHTLSWDGEDAGGAQLGSGVYFLVLQAGEERISRRLMLVR
jgi:hypothetical protein